ncbi:hypothetical protein FBUS_05265 [Fasciolopsis buskii]|uniref:Uncharacterized protein n=1 Tax=Fasciolopsis buskii TaxID=27845 RepID=A0A8E0VI62_9TREM|nr:hypothetical protein FBUS_05265 [Fasciolopsis buski]
MTEGPLCNECLSRGRFSTFIKVRCTNSESVYYCQNEKVFFSTRLPSFSIQCPHFVLPVRAGHFQTKIGALRQLASVKRVFTRMHRPWSRAPMTFVS